MRRANHTPAARLLWQTLIGKEQFCLEEEETDFDDEAQIPALTSLSETSDLE